VFKVAIPDGPKLRKDGMLTQFLRLQPLNQFADLVDLFLDTNLGPTQRPSILDVEEKIKNVR
jgi:hypothetical protein